MYEEKNQERIRRAGVCALKQNSERVPRVKVKEVLA